MRPVLRPGLRLLRDAADRVVLVEGDRVYPLDAVTADLLSRLDGAGDEATVLAGAARPGGAADGADGSTVAAAWHRLRAAGVVVDVEAPAVLVRPLDERLRRRALPEASALLAHDPHTAEDRWRRRRGATVAVAGQGAVTTALVGLLEQAGMGRVGSGASPLAGRPADQAADVTVLTGDHEPPAEVVEHLMREDRAHLVAGMRGPVGTVGPFVLPGSTPCLRCVDLTRGERDRGWAAVRDRLSAPDGRGGGTTAPASRVVTSAVAALAAADVLAHVEGRRTTTAGATASLSLLDPSPSLQRWPAHPVCGCAWHRFAAGRGQWGT